MLLLDVNLESLLLNPCIIFVRFSNEYGSTLLELLEISLFDDGGKGGGFEDVMEENEGSWMTDSMGGDRKDTWAELVLRGG